MARLEAIDGISVHVYDIHAWGWFYMKVLKGRLVNRGIDEDDTEHWRIAFPYFDVVLISRRLHPPSSDHYIREVAFTTGDLVGYIENLPHLHRSSCAQSGGLAFGRFYGVLDDARDRAYRKKSRGLLRNVDHITLAVQSVENAARFFCGVLGGELEKTEDVDPLNPNSSMKLWTANFGTFGIALVEGINRGEASHVSIFTKKRGNGTIQHPAFEVGSDLLSFCSYGRAEGMRFRGQVITRRDERGMVQQIFGKSYTNEFEVSARQYPEFMHRVQPGEAFNVSKDAGRLLAEELEKARALNDPETLIDFTVPDEWDPWPGKE